MHIATGLQGMESSRAAIKSSHDIHQPLGPPLGPQAESRELGRFVGSASWLAKHPGSLALSAYNMTTHRMIHAVT